MARFNKEVARKQRHVSIRRKVVGTSEKPRLCVRKSLRHIYAQIIDDTTGKSLVQVTSNSKEFKKEGGKSFSNSGTAQKLGLRLAQLAKDKGIKTVSFDRGGYKYHGNVKALADAAREGGLEF